MHNTGSSMFEGTNSSELAIPVHLLQSPPCMCVHKSAVNTLASSGQNITRFIPALYSSHSLHSRIRAARATHALLYANILAEFAKAVLQILCVDRWYSTHAMHRAQA